MKSNSQRFIKIKFYQLLWITILMVAANNLCLFADSVICSRLCGADNLVAIQMTSPVISFVNFVYWMFGIGGSLVCFERISKNRKTEGDSIFTASLVFSVLIGALVCLACNLLSSPLITILCPRPELREAASTYMRIYSIAFPFLSFVLTMGYFMRADGITKLPFIAILLTNVTNITLDNVLISVFGMGIGGAAWASVSGYMVGTVISCLYFLNRHHTLHIRFSVGTCLGNAAVIMKRGFSSASTQIYYLLRSLFLNSWMSYIDPKSLTPMTVFLNTLFIPYMVYIGLSQTISPIVSLYNTEKNYESVKYIVKKVIRIALIMTGALALLFAVCPGLITALFSIRDSENQIRVFSAFRILPFSYIFSGLSFILIFYLQAIGKSKLSSLLSFFDSLILLAFYSVILGLGFGSDGIWIAFLLSPITVLLIYFLYTRKTKNSLFVLPEKATRTVGYEISKENLSKSKNNVTLPYCIPELASMLLSSDILYDAVNVTILSEGEKDIVRIRYYSNIAQDDIISAASCICENAVYSNVLGMHCISFEVKNSLL